MYRRWTPNNASGLVACLPSSAIVSDANAIVWIQFSHENVSRSAPHQHSHLHQNHHIQLIFPTTRSFTCSRTIETYRMQYPIRPPAAKTVWRAQSHTYTQLPADFTGRPTPHIHYVAISRATTIDSLHLINFNPDRITLDHTVVQEMNRL